MRKVILTLLFLFSVSKIYAGVINIGAASYTDTLPSGKLKPQTNFYATSNISTPVPSSDWWTSVLSSSYSSRMYAYPLCYKCISQGFLIGYPETIPSQDYVSFGSDLSAPYRQQLLVQGMYNGISSTVTVQSVKVDSFGDWSLTSIWQDSVDPSNYFTATYGHGFIFTYFNFSSGVNPMIAFPLEWGLGQLDIYDSAGNLIAWDNPVTGESFSLRYLDYATGKEIYYGVFLPNNSVFSITNKGHIVNITLPAGKDFMSIGLMKDKASLSFLRNYAYAFITDTEYGSSFDTAKSVVTSSFTATTQPKQFNQNTTLIALFPHQWKNASGISEIYSFPTLRGDMKVIAADSFTVSNRFHGIMPYLLLSGNLDDQYLKTLLNDDKDYTFKYDTVYYHGKELVKVANLIPIADQLGEIGTRDSLIAKLKASLLDWFTYTNGKTGSFFYYDKTWGAMLGYNMETEFYLHTIKDQHFVLGYYVYASAVLAMYDISFKTDYGDMVELLIRSYASPYRNDAMFPYLRTFDPYEGHSWANGMALSDDGNDQESSSEAMNSWAGIYLWGMATNKDIYRTLGICGYALENSALQEYYFDTDNTTYSQTYGHSSIGRLFGGKVDYNTWFGSEPEYIHGIQILPLTPSMLYLGYNADYARINYNHMVQINGGTEDKWYDIFWKYQSFFDPQSAIRRFRDDISYDDADSKTAVYSWLKLFALLGKPDTNVYSNMPSFAAFDRNGRKTWMAFNPANTLATAKFYDSLSGELIGSVSAGANSIGVQSTLPVSAKSSNDLSKVIAYPNPYLNNPGGIIFSGIANNSRIKILDIAGEVVQDFEENDGDGIYQWDAKNKDGDKLASGVYLYLVTNTNAGQQKVIGKLAIIK
ncbi:MAG: T9SS type A sorting domain-containing protein [Elusimicrobia bacterium]|nr:T9SS type A sorting domain-containing protein [Candidatus Liberimonas magnetica]